MTLRVFLVRLVNTPTPPMQHLVTFVLLVLLLLEVSVGVWIVVMVWPVRRECHIAMLQSSLADQALTRTPPIARVSVVPQVHTPTALMRMSAYNAIPTRPLEVGRVSVSHAKRV